MSFETLVNRIFSREGYWSDNPADRGGLTIWGISSRSFPEDVKKLRGMPRDESQAYAAAVYRREFWDRVLGDDLGRIAGLDLADQVFDFAVTSSPMTSVRALQRTLNVLALSGKWTRVKEDGKMGPQTLGALEAAVTRNRARAQVLLGKVFRWMRMKHYEEIVHDDPSQGIFLEGWFLRI